jgi:hypothetical protein
VLSLADEARSGKRQSRDTHVHSLSPLIHIKAVIGRRYYLVPVRQRRAT